MAHRLPRAALPLALALTQLCGVATAEEAYTLKPGDVLQVAVWKEADLTMEVLVRPDGAISFPLAGDIPVAGKSVEQVRAILAGQLQKYIADPEVAVMAKQLSGNTIYVLGKVNRPGAFALSGPVDVMQALAMAGGTSTFAALNDIKVLRRGDGRQSALGFRYGDVQAGKALEQNVLLQSGDVVVVP